MSMRLVFFLGLTLFFSYHLVNASWQNDARRLNGESERVTLSMVQKLKHVPNLNDALVNAWPTPDRHLALEVISNLHITSLISFLEERAFKDPDGYTLLTLNTFLNSKNQGEILARQFKQYDEMCHKLSPQLHFIILDFMGRTRRPLSPKCRTSIESQYPELSVDLKVYDKRLNP